MNIVNDEFKAFLSSNKKLFTTDELQILESNDYSNAAEVLFRKRHLFPSSTRFGRLILSMIQGDVNLSVVKYIRANMFYPSKAAEQYLIYLESFGSVIYGADHYTKRANLNNYLMCHTFSGSGMLEYEGQCYPQHPGDCFFIDCRTPHYYYCNSTQWGYDVVHFNGKAVAAYYSQIKRCNCISIHVENLKEFADSLHLLSSYCDDPTAYNEFTINSSLTSMLTVFTNRCDTGQSSSIPEWLKNAISYINSHYFENLTLDKLAHEVNISKYHLTKSIKAYTGKTFLEYLNQLRTEEAKKLLLTTSLPISIISETIGYESESYFITLFRRIEGITPLQFRKSKFYNG